MTPFIPLSPQQKRQRRKNLLFFTSCTGAALAFLTYLFFTDLRELATPDEEPAAPEASPAQAAEAAAEPAAEAPEEPATGGGTGYTLSAEHALSEDPLLSGSASAPQAGPPAPQPKSQPSEEELAKLPPWKAAFERLSHDDKLAYIISFTKAKEAYNSNQWANCQAFLNDCELINNANPDVWNLRACALLASQELPEAEVCINRSLELNPEDAVALMARAELLMLRRDFRGCIPILEGLRQRHRTEKDRPLHDMFSFSQLLCHLMLRQEMEARAIAAGLTPLSDTPLYYYSEAAFSIYQGQSIQALEHLRSATTIYGNTAASYRKWLNQCGLAEKYGSPR